MAGSDCIGGLRERTGYDLPALAAVSVQYLMTKSPVSGPGAVPLRPERLRKIFDA